MYYAIIIQIVYLTQIIYCFLIIVVVLAKIIFNNIKLLSSNTIVLKSGIKYKLEDTY